MCCVSCPACVTQMMEAHLSRDKAIKACIAQTSEVVGQLRDQRGKDSENLAIIKQLRKEQTKVIPVSDTRGQCERCPSVAVKLNTKYIYSKIINNQTLIIQVVCKIYVKYLLK